MIKPAILETKISEIKRKIKQLESLSPTIHVDIIDNTLVKAKTYLNVQKILDIKTTAVFEIHLMVKDPIKYIPTKNVKLKNVISQIEISNVDMFIKYCKANGYRCGLSLHPDTHITQITPYLKKIDFIQFMTVLPGRQGRGLEVNVLEKIKIFKKKYPNIKIQVDGAMDFLTIKKMETEIDVDDYVVGSDIYTNENPKKEKQLLETLLH